MGAADARVGQVRCGVAQMRWKALAMSFGFGLEVSAAARARTSNGKSEMRILRCARNDSVKQAKTTATAKTEADPCGMTNKRTSKDNCSSNGCGSVFSLASFSVVG